MITITLPFTIKRDREPALVVPNGNLASPLVYLSLRCVSIKQACDLVRAL